MTHQIRPVERNGNPQAAAASRPAESAGSAVFLQTSLGLPLTGGLEVKFTGNRGGNAALAGLSIVDRGGQTLLQTNAQSGSIQLDPDGLLAFSDGYTITRWNPATRQSQSFAYSFPDHYGCENFDGMVALPEGRTLIIGTAGRVRPHLVSLHDPDGSPCLKVDLAAEAECGDATIDDVFVSYDRQRVYLSCHHSLGTSFGHAVHRLNLAGAPAMERLTFYLTDSPFQHSAVVLENEDILLLQGGLVQRCCWRGAVQESYDSLLSLRHAMGSEIRPLARMPLL